MRLIVRLSILVGFMLMVSSAYAQHFTNDWVNVGQDYYRLAIPRNGVYRIYRSQLESAGVPIGSFNPQNMQLYQNGKPLACHIDGESAGLLNYIEFYAEGNTGWFDVEMFDKPESQANPHYSMITDTAAVFLTWNKSFSNLRFTPCASSGVGSVEEAEYCIIDTVCQYVATYLGGEENCFYTEAEGWFDASALSLGGKLTKQVPAPNVYAGQPLTAKVSLAMATYSSNAHHITITGPGISFDTIFIGLKNVKCSATFDASKLSPNNDYVFGSVNDVNAATDYSRVVYIGLEYPATFKFDGRHKQEFVLPPADADLCVTFEGLAVSADMVLYDVTRNLRISVVGDGGKASAVVPSHSQPVKMIVADAKGLAAVPSISHSPFADHSKGGKPVLIITSKRLMQSARAYADYRDAYLADVDEICNQFGYGISKHPMAIRHFIEFVTSKWTNKPQYLILLGKGVSPYDSRKNEQAIANNLVPSMGYPSSDALLSAFVDGSGMAPSLATGRISALTDGDVTNYLDKVKAYESNPQSEWMKRVVHFVGGKTAYEQSTMRYYMSEYAKIISDTLFGAQVTSFYKSTSDPISTSKNDSVRILINGGVSLMTFFGHGSSGGGFDQDIDVPSYYSNEGKYPLILSNSCYTGNVFSVWQTSVSEEWVLAPKKGAIGLIAMVNEGVPSYLDKFTSVFYRHIANSSYGEPIGKSMLIAQTQMSNTANRLTLGTLQQMTLHGDPCIVLNSPSKPDLQIEPSDVWFSPSELTTEIDSFTVSVAVRNVGRAITSEFSVDMQRTMPDGSTVVRSQLLNGLKFRDTLKFCMPIERLTGVGINKFSITLDAMNRLDEMSEDNNSANLDIYVLSSELSTVFPYRYSLNPQVPPVFKASTPNALLERQVGVFQIDTTECFDSPLLHAEKVSHSGGVVDWTPSCGIKNDQTYFWRAKNQTDDDYGESSSFIVRNGLEGWEQSHFEQIDDDAFQYINHDSGTRTFSFASAPRTIRCHNIGSPNSSNFLKVGYVMDGYSAFSSCGANNALLVVVIDSFNLVPWQSDRGNYGQSNYPNCSSNPYEQYFIFYLWDLDASLSALENMIETYVPNGDYFMIYSFMSGRFQQWPESAYEAFERWGATRVRNINSSVPYIFFAHKGNPDETEEVVGLSATDQIDFYKTMYSNFNYGTITSPQIGPAKQWTSVEWAAESLDSGPGDKTSISVFGIGHNGSQTPLFEQVSATTVDLSGIDASDYNYLKLSFFTSDDEYRTPSQLKMWRVLYTPYTDLAINLKRAWSFNSDTLSEGQQGCAVLAYENVGLQWSDSVLVHYWIQTATNKIADLGYRRFKPLNSGEYVVDTVFFSTVGLESDNVFHAELNPKPVGSLAYDQTEQTHFNNFLQKSFVVVGDKVNPLMDVTFDGRHIHDGEIVSARPVIEIRVTDDNQFLALSDTSLVSVYITSFANGVEQKIDLFHNPDAAYNAGSLGDNTVRVKLLPKLADGTYQLRVRSHDVSGNESGIDDYVISFNIVSESAISDVFAFPNPFSSEMRFGFELTGSELPDEFRIDIYNRMGVIVKTITRNDLGNLHIGQNLSAYSWNGTGDNGALLPAGIYYYKVTVSLNGKKLARRAVGRDSYMSNGVGRIVIVR